jgi:hypothetical protein
MEPEKNATPEATRTRRRSANKASSNDKLNSQTNDCSTIGNEGH